jgi:hypothetical protein
MPVFGSRRLLARSGRGVLVATIVSAVVMTSALAATVEPRVVTQVAVMPAPGGGPYSTVTARATSCHPQAPALCASVAIGYGASYQNYGLYYVLTGATWHSGRLPMPAGASLHPSGVSCTTGNVCYAVGGWEPHGSPFARPYIAKYVGGAWHMMAVPSVLAAGYGPHSIVTHMAVSCLSAVSCLAVGAATWTGGTHAFAYALVGASWVPKAIAIPAGMGSTNLEAVSCQFASFCSASGTAATPSFAPRGFEVLYLGGVVHVYLHVIPGATYFDSPGVSCVALNHCYVVVSYYDAASHGHAIVESQVGGAWAPRVLAAPAGWPLYLVHSISCASPTICVAEVDAKQSTTQRPVFDVVTPTSTAPVLGGIIAGTNYTGSGTISCVGATVCRDVDTYYKLSNGTTIVASLLTH